jgi:hypothetical protein
LHGALEAVGYKPGSWMHALSRVAREHPDGYRMVAVHVSARDEGAIARHEINDSTGGLADGPPGQGLTENPRVATAQTLRHIIRKPICPRSDGDP